MRRIILAAAAVLLTAPALMAQSTEPELRPKFRVTPWVGYRVGYSQQGVMAVTNGDTTTQAVFEFDSDGSAAGGLEADMRVWGPWSVIGGVAYAGADAVRLRTGFDNGESETVFVAPRLHFAKLGVAFRLREPEPDFRLHRPTASVFVAPALVRVDPPDQFGNSLDEPFDQWGLNFGFKGESPLWSRRVLLHIGAEDYFTFWSEDVPARRFDAEFDDPDIRTVFDYDPSHVLMLRVGLSFSF